MARANICVGIDQKSFVLGTRESWHKLTVLSNGHLACQIIPNAGQNNRIEYAMYSLTTENIAKLHKQIGHCKTEKMIGLLKTAGHDERSLRKCVEKVTDSCEVCIRYGRVKCKPKVSAPMSSDFNQTVCIDLHQLSKATAPSWYIHVIDSFTRFSVRRIMYDKKLESIIRFLLEYWNFLFGVPEQLLTDYGGEFVNNSRQSFCDMFGILHIITAAESPFSNGICERHNGIITEKFKKSSDDSSDIDSQIVFQ